MSYKLTIIDWLVIILNVSYHLTMVKVYTFDLLPIQPFIWLTIFTLSCYFIRFGARATFGLYFKNNIILWVFFLIYLFDVLQCLFFDPLSALLRLLTAVELFIFGTYIFRLWDPFNDFSSNVIRISKPYVYFSVYNVVVVLLVAVLIMAGLINPESNPIEPNSLTKVDASEGQSYFFPYYLSLTTSSFRILGALGLPMITGLSHEPHVACFLILPSLFLIIADEKLGIIRYLFISLYLFFFVINFSTTAFFALSCVMFLECIWLFTTRRKLSSIIPLILSILLVIFYGGSIIELMSDEITRKTVDSTSSVEYSERMLTYMLHPTGILGDGNMPGDLSLNKDADIGILTFLLNAIFVFYLINTTLKMIFSKKQGVHYIGIASVYLLVHSIKTNMLNFNYPYFAFFVFVISLYYSKDIRKRRNN